MRHGLASVRTPSRLRALQSRLLGNVLNGILRKSLVALHQLVGSLEASKVIRFVTPLLEPVQLLCECFDLARYPISGATKGVQCLLCASRGEESWGSRFRIPCDVKSS